MKWFSVLFGLFYCKGELEEILRSGVGWFICCCWTFTGGLHKKPFDQLDLFLLFCENDNKTSKIPPDFSLKIVTIQTLIML